MAVRRTSGQGSMSVGVDVGGTKILAALVNPEGQILATCKRRTRAERGVEEVIERVVRSVHDVVDEVGLMFHEIRAVGVGVPGPVDTSRGFVSVAPNLGWKDLPIGDLLSQAMDGTRVVVGNDANCCILGEHRFGAARGFSHVVGMFIGTGVGGGLILNGQLYTGAGQLAGEVGHMTIRMDGPRTAAGFRGTVESLGGRLAIVSDIELAIASGKKSIISELEDAEGERRVRSKMLARAFELGDKVVVRAVKRSSVAIGLGASALVHALAPECLLLGGGVVEALGQGYVDRIERTCRAHIFPAQAANLVVRMSSLGDHAGVLGAASLAMEALAAGPASKASPPAPAHVAAPANGPLPASSSRRVAGPPAG